MTSNSATIKVPGNPEHTRKLVRGLLNPRPNREVVCANALHLLITRYGRTEVTARRILGLSVVSSN